ncbi:MAG: hypothetical protein G8345_08780 [Magnetococcales bacterium]|nr:hypothetical protein [Magnetococcales bacterium]NGZ26969.1 hypothetical protein [Magnetococcales bacterium]
MKARIILFTLAWLALFSLGVGGVVAYFALYRAVELEEQSHAERTASIMATKINIFLNAFKRSVDAMATLPQVVRLVDGKEHDLVGVNHVLADYCRALQGDICYVMNRAGDTLAASNWRESTSLVGKNYAFRPYFQKALAGESGFYAAMGVTTHVRGLYISSPVVGQDGVTIGVAVIKFSLSGIDKEFYDVPMPVILTDENGIIFAANREKWLFHTLNPLPYQRFKEIAESLKMGDKPLPVLGLTETNSRKHYAIGQEAERYRLGKESVPLLPGWHIYYLSILEEDSTTEALNRLGEYSLLVTLFVLAIAGGVWQLFRMGLQDIFQRQQAETALMDSRRLIQDVVDQQSEVVFVCNPIPPSPSIIIPLPASSTCRTTFFRQVASW